MIDGKIYLVTNQINQKRYVGQAKDTLNKRWSQHRTKAKESL
jgi:hypothetical protein